jgi:hypothetical protein
MSLTKKDALEAARLIREASNTLLSQAAAVLSNAADDSKNREHQERINYAIFQVNGCAHFLEEQFRKKTRSREKSRQVKQGKEAK